MLTMNLLTFIEEIKKLCNEDLLERYVASQIEERENFLKAEWIQESLPFVEALRAEVLRRMK